MKTKSIWGNSPTGLHKLNNIKCNELQRVKELLLVNKVSVYQEKK